MRPWGILPGTVQVRSNKNPASEYSWTMMAPHAGFHFYVRILTPSGQPEASDDAAIESRRVPSEYAQPLDQFSIKISVAWSGGMCRP